MQTSWRKWAPEELAALAQLRNHYDTLVVSFLDKLRLGQPVRIGDSLSDDQAVLGAAGLYSLDARYAVREAYVLDAILARIRNLNERQPSELRQFLKTVDDVVLRRCGVWLATAPDLEATGVEEFAAGMKIFDVRHGRQLGLLLRSLLILLLASDRPDGVGSIQPEHLLFPQWFMAPAAGTKKATIAQSDREVADLVLDAIPLDLVAAFVRLPEYILDEQASGSDSPRRGRFTIARNTYFRWAFAEAETAEKLPGFEELILPHAEVILEVLDLVLRARGASMARAGMPGVDALKSRSSVYALSDTRYTIVRQAITALTHAQLVTAWNDAKGEQLPSTTLATRHGYTVRKGDDAATMLICPERGWPFPVCLGAVPPGWSSYVPVCAAILRRFMLAANKLVDGV